MGEYRTHTCQGTCRACVNRTYPCVGQAGAQGARIQHARETVIVGKFRLATNFGQRIRVGLCLANFPGRGDGCRDIGRYILSGCLLDGRDNTLVAGTAAIGVLQGDLDVGFVWYFTRCLFFIQQSLGCHDYAGGTDAALHCAMIQKRLLQGMQLLVGGKAFDGLYLGTRCLESGEGATDHRCAVDQHRADTALGFIATDLGAGQAQVLA